MINRSPQPGQAAQLQAANEKLGWRNGLFRIYACDEPDCFVLHKMSGDPLSYPGEHAVVHGTVRDCLKGAGLTNGEIDE